MTEALDESAAPRAGIETAPNTGWRRHGVHLFLIGAGYVIAVVAAVIVTVTLFLAPMALPDNGAQGSLFKTLSEVVPPALVIGFFWTLVCAWPGFIAAIVLGERRLWARWKDFAIAGFINVVPSYAMFAALFGPPLSNPWMVAASFPGGFVGGAVYWFVAGRFIAMRRKPA